MTPPIMREARAGSSTFHSAASTLRTGPDARMPRPKKTRPKKTRPKKARPKPAAKARGRESSRSKSTAEAMAKKQREISVSEFFTKNRHLLGFDSPRKALLTAVKEAVDNSLDACEEARCAPDLRIAIQRHPKREQTYTIEIEDNGPGIVPQQVPNIFGKLLYGSKFHRLRQSRGQQGIGISAAGMYGQLTTGIPVRVVSRTGPRATPREFRVRIDTARNKPVSDERKTKWDAKRGTLVELTMEGEYRRGQRSVDEFLKLCAVTNPHAEIRFTDPDGNETVYERATDEVPPETAEIKPHPHGVELGILIRMLQDSSQRWLTAFLNQEFSRVGNKVAKEICDRAGVSERANPRRIARAEADRLKKAIDATKIMAPSTSCIAPIGEELILAGLRKEVEADFYIAKSRPPVVYRGRPFAIEVGLAFGRPGDTLEVTDEGRIVESKAAKKRKPDDGLMGYADEPARLIRYANRVPLLYQQAACAITKSVVATNWRSYGLQQPRGTVPVGPLVILVHIASVWVPFTSESKEAIAGYPEILKEIRLALQDCGRKLGTHIRKGRRLAAEHKKRSYIETYIPHIGEALREILSLSDAQTAKTVAKLTEVLQRSRKL